MQNFKCKVCATEKPLEDSVSLYSKICVTCFTSIQIHERVSDKINFYKKILSESEELTAIRIKKIRFIEKLNEIFSFLRVDIFQSNDDEIKNYIEDLEKEKLIKSLRYWKKEYIVREYERDSFDFKKMSNALRSYRPKIVDANNTKSKFNRFIEIIGKESQFRVLKNMLLNSITQFIQEDNKKEFDHLKKFVFDGVASVYEPKLIPNISLFINDNYERIFSTLLTKLLPFDIQRISFNYPTVNSRTDFGLTLFYRYNAIELHAVEKAIDKYSDKNKVKLEPTMKFLFINSIKTISAVMDELLQYYYKKLRIPSNVRTIVNILASNQKSTKRYNEVTYKIHMREW